MYRLWVEMLGEKASVNKHPENTGVVCFEGGMKAWVLYPSKKKARK